MNNRFKDEGLEYLVAQLYSVDNYTTSSSDITPTPVFKINWGDILGNITNQTDLMNYLSNLQDEIEDAISKIANVYKYKGTVPTKDDLPNDAEMGDVYNVEDTGANYAWTGEFWDKLSDTIDVDLDDYVKKETLALYYLKEEVDALIAGITIDGYTKEEVDTLLLDKADKSTIYTKTETDNLLTAKANASETYTKAEIDDIIDDLPVSDNVYTKDETNALLAEKVDTTALENYYTKEEVDEIVEELPTPENVYTKAETDALLAEKADATSELEDSPENVGKIVQYLGDSDEEHTKGYFYQYNKVEDNVEFQSTGDTETVVTIDSEDFSTFIKDLCEQNPQWNSDGTDITHGHIGYFSEGRYSFSGYSDEGSVFYTSFTLEELEEAGFTFEPPLSAQQGIDYTCTITDGNTYVWEQVDIQPEIDISGKADVADLEQEIEDRQSADTALQNAIDEISGDLDNYYTKAEIDAKTTALFKYKGQVETVNELPDEDNLVGDTWNVIESGANYTWNGEDWDKLSETIDLSPYALKTNLSEVSARVEILEGKDFVEYTDLSTSTYPNRKGILLDENNGIYGKDSLERVKLISMISNDTVEFGAGSLQTNINTTGNLLINGEGNVVTDKNLGNFITAGEDISIDVTVTDGKKSYTINAELGNLENDLANEVSAREEADAELQNSLTSITGDFTDFVETVEEHFIHADETYARKTDLTAETNARTQADNKKVDKEITTANGKALIFNEADGGGAKFEGAERNSFAGVNDMTDPNHLGVQLYNIDKSTKVGPRINLTADRATYSIDKTEVGADYEILIKKDLGDYYTKTEVDDLIEDIDAGQLRQDLDAEIQNRIDADDALDTRVTALEETSQAVFHYKGNVNTYDDLEEIQNQQIGDVYNVLDTGSNYAWDGEEWDKLSETVDLSAYDTIADREAAINAVLSKIWTGTLQNGHLYSKKTNAQGGYALIFNEEDGGGSQVFDKTANTKSYVGTNLEEGTGKQDGVNVQIYSLDDTTKEGVRLNINTQKAYYLKGSSKQNVAGREIVVQDDLAVKANQADLEELQETVDTSLAHQDGNIQALLLQMETLEQKIKDLKSLDYEVITIYEGDDTDFDNEEKSFQLSGVVDTRLIANGKDVTLDEATVESAYVNLLAIEDVTIRNTTFTGIIPKTVTNAFIQVHADGYVSIRDCVITPESCYNGIEIGLTNGLAKSVIIDNCRFDGKFANNGINIFGMDDFGVVTISNCYFKDLSNLLRISNRTNTTWTINLINCTCDKWELGQYAGAILLQDYTSGSAAQADENNQFAKLTINIQNLTKPDGTKLVMPEDLSEICGTRDDNQIIYMYDSWRGHTTYGNKYPTIHIQ